MKAVVYDTYGTPDVLRIEEVKIPKQARVKPDNLVVRFRSI